MKRCIITAGLALAIVPAASAHVTQAHLKQYTKLYHTVAHKFNARTPGRNIVRDGLSNGHYLTDAIVVKSIGVLRTMLAPPPPPSYAPVPTTTSTSSPAPTYSSSTSYSTSTTSGAGAAGVPACASESGTNYSTGPSNTNPSSGATGRYQILPSTAAAFNCNMGTAAGQDACAQAIYAQQGASAWVGCGG